MRKKYGIFTLVMLSVSLIHTAETSSAAAATPSVRPNLSASQIADQNVAARGGLMAWRSVQALSLQGKMGAGGNQRTTLAIPMRDPKEFKDTLPHRPAEEAQLPFVMDMQRPRKVRIELQFNRQTAVQVYDGTNGWKVRPFLNRPEVEPYTAEELKIASLHEDLDGPLVDYAAKGSHVDLDGNETVEGRNTYKLKVTENNGHVFHIWIDAETFLEAKVEGQPRRLDGTDHPVEIYYRDYRTVDGLKIPFVIETRVLKVAKNALNLQDTPVPPEKILIDKVVVNPKLDAKLFSRPTVSIASHGE